MMPQPPHHKEEQPRGLPDETVDAAHEFMEHAEHDRELVEHGEHSSLSNDEEEDTSMFGKAKGAKEMAKEKLGLKGQQSGQKQ